MLDLAVRAAIASKFRNAGQTCVCADRFLVHSSIHDEFVEKLTDALMLSRTAGKGQRFVTATGEMLDARGSLTVGPLQANVGLVSRRSELRALKKEMVDLQGRMAEFTEEITRLQQNIDKQERENKFLVDDFKKLSGLLADQRVQTRTLQDRFDQLDKQRETIAAERDAAQAKYESTAEKLEKARAQRAETDAEVKNLEIQIQAAEGELPQRVAVLGDLGARRGE